MSIRNASTPKLYLLLIVSHIICSPTHAERTILGCITDADDQAVPRLQVVAYDSDSFPEGDAFPPWPAGDAHDLMGSDITDESGCYRINYPRPGGADPGGGHWDGTLDHGLDQRWRPDVFIQVSAPTDGFCDDEGTTTGPAWRFVEDSNVFTNQRTAFDLTLNLRLDEFFDLSCGTLGPFENLMEPKGNKLRGVVDLHTHPMAHLGFGGKIFHGAPDIGSLMVSGTHNCNSDDFRVDKIVKALPRGYSTHGGWDRLDNLCGNLIRHEIIKAMEAGQDAQSDHGKTSRGFRHFSSWPRYNDITHQQMWVDWIYRAYRGGLRVMVSLAVNSRTLATAVDGNDPRDDLDSGNRQLAEIQGFVSRHAFMEIAYTPSQLRDIVSRNKLAVVLGVELDDLGNMLTEDPVSRNRVTSVIEDLYDRGVRYIFPVHVIDNHFGGTAAYEDLFAVANWLHFGSWWNLSCAAPADNINFSLGLIPEEASEIIDGLAEIDISLPLDLPTPLSCEGQRNQRGLTDLGAFAMAEMMRLGMVIDVDHMSQRTANDALALGESYAYPLNSGHNGWRDLIADEDNRAENSRTEQQYNRIAALGGLAGVGWAGSNAEAFLQSLQEVSNFMGGRNLAFGTDINGLVVGPAPVISGPVELALESDRPVEYSTSFPRARTGMKKWDYNEHGVAHYGLMPDFMVHIQQLTEGPEMVEKLFDGAEAFATMWDAADSIRDSFPAVLVTTVLW